MYYLETKEVCAVSGKVMAVWKAICYGSLREPLDEMVNALGSDRYRVTLAAERRIA